MQASLSEPQDHRRDVAGDRPALYALSTHPFIFFSAEWLNRTSNSTMDEGDGETRAHDLYLNPEAHKV